MEGGRVTRSKTRKAEWEKRKAEYKKLGMGRSYARSLSSLKLEMAKKRCALKEVAQSKQPQPENKDSDVQEPQENPLKSEKDEESGFRPELHTNSSKSDNGDCDEISDLQEPQTFQLQQEKDENVSDSCENTIVSLPGTVENQQPGQEWSVLTTDTITVGGSSTNAIGKVVRRKRKSTKQTKRTPANPTRPRKPRVSTGFRTGPAEDKRRQILLDNYCKQIEKNNKELTEKLLPIQKAFKDKTDHVRMEIAEMKQKYEERLESTGRCMKETVSLVRKLPHCGNQNECFLKCGITLMSACVEVGEKYGEENSQSQFQTWLETLESEQREMKKVNSS